MQKSSMTGKRPTYINPVHVSIINMYLNIKTTFFAEKGHQR